uniref:Ubiquitin-like protease family profile domain-containing protein n=1 Tax=Timema cristinae TaxID=61476 RepID=A0A7R9CBS7_TIMCR|nr:unnamed protein product [Timema cristinae]
MQYSRGLGHHGYEGYQRCAALANLIRLKNSNASENESASNSKASDIESASNSKASEIESASNSKASDIESASRRARLVILNQLVTARLNNKASEIESASNSKASEIESANNSIQLTSSSSSGKRKCDTDSIEQSVGLHEGDPPKQTSDKLALCSNCGFTSSDFNKCQRCTRKLSNTVKTVAMPNFQQRSNSINVNVVKSPEESHKNSSTKVAIRSIRIKKHVKSPVIVVSSDDEETGAMCPDPRIKLNSKTSEINSLVSNVDKSPAVMGNAIPCVDSVGQQSIDLFLKDICKVWVYHDDIPSIIFYCSPTCGGKVRDLLKMSSGAGGPFYDPENNDEGLRTITVYLEKSELEDTDVLAFIRHLFPSPEILKEVFNEDGSNPKPTAVTPPKLPRTILTRLTTNREASQGPDSLLPPPKRRHNRVFKWTKKVNIFEKDFIIIPVNQDQHWYLVTICFPGLLGPVRMSDNTPIFIEPLRYKRKDTKLISIDEDLEVRDEADAEVEDLELGWTSEEAALQKNSDNTANVSNEAAKEPIKQPCILVFDSLPFTPRNRIVATLREYLGVEYKNKVGKDRVFNKDNMRASSVVVPRQTNTLDCGLFVLQYVESFFLSPINDYRLPIKTLNNWFPQELVNHKREDICQLLHRLMEENNVDIDSLDLPDLYFSVSKQNYYQPTDENCQTEEIVESEQHYTSPEEGEIEGHTHFPLVEDGEVHPHFGMEDEEDCNQAFIFREGEESARQFPFTSEEEEGETHFEDEDDEDDDDDDFDDEDGEFDDDELDYDNEPDMEDVGVEPYDDIYCQGENGVCDEDEELEEEEEEEDEEDGYEDEENGVAFHQGDQYSETLHDEHYSGHFRNQQASNELYEASNEVVVFNSPDNHGNRKCVAVRQDVFSGSYGTPPKKLKRSIRQAVVWQERPITEATMLKQFGIALTHIGGHVGEASTVPGLSFMRWGEVSLKDVNGVLWHYVRAKTLF